MMLPSSVIDTLGVFAPMHPPGVGITLILLLLALIIGKELLGFFPSRTLHRTNRVLNAHLVPLLIVFVITLSAGAL